MHDVRAMLKELTEGNKALGQEMSGIVGPFSAFMKADGADGALSAKFKELICVAMAAYNRCEYCIVYHVYNAYKYGANRKEILEAALTAMGFGGGPTMAYT